ncbi:hypothetical protein DPX16_7519 [Anabarilius grahami]|uniref:Uncharacterized protein n=1 Tax=Anabarilius grahami TaxID=495550 RepID=A0A3N0ZAX6_ANAGA|nr:hypothetical protein DPX16_7519 [Anabarilius grahami]
MWSNVFEQLLNSPPTELMRKNYRKRASKKGFKLCRLKTQVWFEDKKRTTHIVRSPFLNSNTHLARSASLEAVRAETKTFICKLPTRDRTQNPHIEYFCAIFSPLFTMDLPAIQRKLEEHTKNFLDLVCLTHYPDRSLCVFYNTSLREQSKAHLLGVGPRGYFTAFVKWALVNKASAFTIFPTSPTLDPEPSQPPPTHCTERTPEPTAERELESAAMD